MVADSITTVYASVDLASPLKLVLALAVASSATAASATEFI
jgi:hypothetical protein